MLLLWCLQGVMHQLIEFAKNDQQEVRIDLPPLKHTIPSA